jgi:hypothetical protein
MEQLDDTARRLLREMGYQAEGKPTPLVLPREAARSLDLDPSSQEYLAALDHLEALGDIKRKAPPDLDLPGYDLYQLTRQGLERAREIRWR